MANVIRINYSGFFRTKYSLGNNEIYDKKINFSINKTEITDDFIDLLFKNFFTGDFVGNDGSNIGNFYVSFTTDNAPSLGNTEFVSRIDFTNVVSNIDKVEMPNEILYILKFNGSYTETTDTTTITGISIYYNCWKFVNGEAVPTKILVMKNIDLYKNTFFNPGLKFSNRTDFEIEFSFSVSW